MYEKRCDTCAGWVPDLPPLSPLRPYCSQQCYPAGAYEARPVAPVTREEARDAWKTKHRDRGQYMPMALATPAEIRRPAA